MFRKRIVTEIQKNLIAKFDAKFNNPSYREMVRITGIEQEVLFKIRNGWTMTAQEIQKFDDLTK